MRISKRTVASKKLRDGMVLAEPIYDIDGKMLFSEGLRLNAKRIERIMRLELMSVMVEESVYDEPMVNDDMVLETQSVRTILEEKQVIRKQQLLNETRNEAAVMVEDLFNHVLDDDTVKTEKIKRIVERLIEAILYDDQVVLNLSNLSTIDDYLLSHSVNVCIFSLVVGIYLGFSQPRLMKLGTGALIHDIGKILVSQKILTKPGPLTEDEFEEMKQHTIYGHKILKDTLKYGEESAAIPLYHHERIDGLGYPEQKKGHEIPLFAKIVCVADVFDAMTTDKVYSDKVSYYQGINYLIKQVNTQFDEDIVKKFITIIGFYPIGLPVKLSTGDIGQVISTNKKKPVVKVLLDANGNRLNNYYEIDLYKNPSISVIDVDVQKPA